MFLKKKRKLSKCQELKNSIADKLKDYDPNASIGVSFCDGIEVEHFTDTVELELEKLDVWKDRHI